ncbi:hypothetical protein EX895_004486 [Sporisorium graminicola]|uniref:Postreplication repair E3 ubiquitin-protein ligase RAD18 n=1 Tax=Sporisorium graminicola TaxID=280036 RepID=A0A4U7KQZ5_9BASI|nr:hypothetical protein EX895_004486 [Sporisorium graminicola]TKY86337.1 hypothetical protein EX895_004486 [Sporisorium graminicola]
MQTSVAHSFDDVTDPSDWLDDFVTLKNLDASLRCDLCFDIYTSPVSIKSCHHTFCSTCIRTHINQSGNSGSFCPKCRQTKAYDSELIPQPVLEVTAIEWKKSRSFLARLQTQARHPPPPQQHAESSRSAATKRPQADTNGASFPSGGASPRRSKRIKTDLRSSLVEQSAGSRSSPLTVEDDEDEYDLTDRINDDQDDRGTRDDGDDDDDRCDADYVDGVAGASSHSSPSKRHVNDPTTSDRQLKADDLVECPICRHKFTVTALNRHLDSAGCYDGFPEPSAEERGLAPKPAKTTSSWFTKNATASSPSTNTDASSSSMANEKRLVRPQYSLKSERDLRKLLDDAGLPTAGDKEKMVERHRQWINIWNANLDSTKARRTPSQLRKDLAAWERTKVSAKDHSAHVDRQKTTWIKSNKSQFDDLIQKAKMGAIKDRKMRDASKLTAESVAASSVEQSGPNPEHDLQVITSSPVIPIAGETRAPAETVGSDS